VDVIERNEQRLRLKVGGLASTAICTLDRASGMAEVSRLALGIRYRRERVALSDIADVVVQRRSQRKSYRPLLEVRLGADIPLGHYSKDEALEAARAIRDFLRAPM
jgi:hypothetical protein